MAGSHGTNGTANESVRRATGCRDTSTIVTITVKDKTVTSDHAHQTASVNCTLKVSMARAISAAKRPAKRIKETKKNPKSIYYYNRTT